MLSRERRVSKDSRHEWCRIRSSTLGNVTAYFSYMFVFFRTLARLQLVNIERNLSSCSVIPYLAVVGCPQQQLAPAVAGVPRALRAICRPVESTQLCRPHGELCEHGAWQRGRERRSACVIDWMMELFVFHCLSSLGGAEILGAPFP